MTAPRGPQPSQSDILDHYEGWRRTGRGAKHYGDILQQCDPKPHHYRLG